MKYQVATVLLFSSVTGFVPAFSFGQGPAAGVHGNSAGELNNDLIAALKSQNQDLVQGILQSLSRDTPETHQILSQIDSEGRTALMLAISEDFGFPTISRIMSLGPDLNQADQDGKTALFYAASKDPAYVKLGLDLVKKGAHVNHRDCFGWTALSLSLMSLGDEHEQFKTLRAFLKSGASLDFLFPNDPLAYPNNEAFELLESRSLLTWAIESRSELLTSFVMEFLEQGKQDLDKIDGRGRTALIQAVESSNFDLVERIVNRGANTTIQDQLGWTATSQLLRQSPPSKALQWDQVKWLKAFLTQGGNSSPIFPSLMRAYSSKKEYEKLRGRSILSWAVENKRADVMSILLEFRADLGPLEPLLMSSIERSNMEMLRLAVQQGAPLCPKTPTRVNSHTPLTLAAEKGSFEVMNFLLNSIAKSEAGLISKVDCDLNTLGKEGKTALQWSVARSDLRIAGLLIQKSKDQYIGIPEFLFMTTNVGSSELKSKWIHYFAALQLTDRLTDLLNLKSESMIAFEGALVEDQSPGFEMSVHVLKSLMNQKAKELYYEEREQEILRQTQSTLRTALNSSQNTPTCISCGDSILLVEGVTLGPAGCPCNVLCDDCSKTFGDMVVNRDGEDISKCPKCNYPVNSQFLRTHGVSEDSAKKVRNRFVDILNAKQLGLKFCPTVGCSGGRIVQPQEQPAFYSCIMCAQEGCIQCGSDHKGDCASFEKEMKEFQNLLKLGAMKPPEYKPEDPNHPDYLKGRFRPCYYCGVITERSDGCNSMHCKRCDHDWHWNVGNSLAHDYVKDSLKFKPLQDPHF